MGGQKKRYQIHLKSSNSMITVYLVNQDDDVETPIVVPVPVPKVSPRRKKNRKKNIEQEFHEKLRIADVYFSGGLDQD